MFDLIQHLQLSNLRHMAVVHETGVDAAFVLPTFVHAAAHTLQRPVVVVSTHQLFLHYAHVCRKLGGPLHLAHLPNDRFLFIDALSRYYVDPTLPAGANLPVAPPAPYSKTTEPAKGNVVYLHHHADVLATLADLIAGQVRQSGPSLILLDDLMPFIFSEAVTSHDVVLFVRRILALAEETNSALLSTAQNNVGDPDGDMLARALPSLADTVLVVKALQSGYSRDVDGQLLVVRGKRAMARNPTMLPEPVHLQFKVGDKGISYFGHGLAAALV
ncbi:Elongator subunit elp6 [Allomyces arbusculus]|nr:Elongator subunit elp6 [Allomyces arbusculus]